VSNPRILAVVSHAATTADSIKARGRCRSLQTSLNRMQLGSPRGLTDRIAELTEQEQYSRLAIVRAMLADPAADTATAIAGVDLAINGSGARLAELAERFNAMIAQSAEVNANDVW